MLGCRANGLATIEKAAEGLPQAKYAFLEALEHHS